ncbi:hypothetical protein ACQKP0_14915 [Heyndrickxia sp. NPDC080065]|uniref:hypothetical protein n=1 Tax=Heyndrickxia sp. NPDC080065 TaxID=3390568 RepID=UPI003CFD3BBA
MRPLVTDLTNRTSKWKLRSPTIDDSEQLMQLIDAVKTNYNLGYRWPANKNNINRNICNNKINWPLDNRYVLSNSSSIAALFETYFLPGEEGVILGTNTLIHPDYRGNPQIHIILWKEIFERFKSSSNVIKSYTTDDLVDYYRKWGFRLWKNGGFQLLNYYPLFLKTPLIKNLLDRFDPIKDLSFEEEDTDFSLGEENIYYFWRDKEEFLKVWVDPMSHSVVAFETKDHFEGILLENNKNLYYAKYILKEKNNNEQIEESLESDFNEWESNTISKNLLDREITLKRLVPPLCKWEIIDVREENNYLFAEILNTGSNQIVVSNNEGEIVNVNRNQKQLIKLGNNISGIYHLSSYSSNLKTKGLTKSIKADKDNLGNLILEWDKKVKFVGECYFIYVNKIGGNVEIYNKLNELIIKQHSDEFGNPFNASSNGYHLTEFSSEIWELTLNKSENELIFKTNSQVRDLSIKKIIKIIDKKSISLEWVVDGEENINSMQTIFMMRYYSKTNLILPLNNGVTSIPILFPDFPRSKDITADNNRLTENWIKWENNNSVSGLFWKNANYYYFDFNLQEPSPQFALELPIQKQKRTNKILFKLDIQNNNKNSLEFSNNKHFGLSHSSISPESIFTEKDEINLNYTINDLRETSQQYYLKFKSNKTLKLPKDIKINAKWGFPGKERISVSNINKTGINIVSVEVSGPVPTSKNESVILKTLKGDLSINRTIESGIEVWQINNKYLNFKISPEFGGSIISMKKGESVNLLCSTFPNKKRMFAMNSWYGGVSTILDDKFDTIETFCDSVDYCEQIGPDGILFKGIEVVMKLKMYPFKLIKRYLTTESSPIIILKIYIEGLTNQIRLNNWIHFPNDENWESELGILNEDRIIKRTSQAGKEYHSTFGPSVIGAFKHSEKNIITAGSPDCLTKARLSPFGTRLHIPIEFNKNKQECTIYLGVLESWEEVRVFNKLMKTF